ncbi:MAG: nucleotide exchange factor GrpE, partial [Pyrinomonadaceae bacterium]
EKAVGLKTRVYELENEIIELQRTIAMVRAERNEIQEKSDRRLKDFENYKYRMDRERRGSFIDQISNLASQMLPVLDNLDRAIDSVGGAKTVSMDGFQQFYDGIALVNQQVNEIFAEMGVQPISTVGQIFDPNLHEAVAAEENPDLPVNSISQEMLRGYRIGNRIIRHSMVKVTTGPPRAAEPKTNIPLPASADGSDIPDAIEGKFPSDSADLPEAE